jgi:hypothetical protein
MLNVYFAGLLQYIFFHFFFNMLQRHCWFTGSCLLFASPLISYFPFVVVLDFLFVLLQFACLGFCNRDWNCIISGGLVVACFFVRCMLFIVVLFEFAELRSCGCSWAFWCFLTRFLFVACSCFPRVCNVGVLHPQLDLLLHCFVVDSP